MKNLLIIDDEEEILNLLQFKLKSDAMQVDTASNGTLAWELFKKKEYPVIITDLRLKDSIDGLELLEKVKKLFPYTQVIIITAHGGEIDAIKSVNLHAFGYVQKLATGWMSTLPKMVDDAFYEYGKLSGNVDWSSLLENPNAPKLSLQEVGELLKGYPSLSEALAKVRGE